MSTILLEDAESRLAQLGQQVSSGEEFIIIRDNKPVTKLVSLPPTESVSHSGNAKDFKDYATTH